MKGLGPKKKEYLSRMDIRDAKDLLYAFPRTYEDRSRLVSIKEAILDEFVYLRLKITSQAHTRYVRSGMPMTKLDATDGDSFLTLIFFHQPYLGRQVRPGMTFDVYGKIQKNGNRYEMVSPLMERPGSPNMGRIVPIYRLTQGITQKDMMNFTGQALDLYAVDESSAIPLTIRNEYSLVDKNTALHMMHRPKTMEDIQKGRKSLVYEEFLVFHVGMKLLKNQKGQEISNPIHSVDLKPLMERFPYALTGAQQRALKEILSDMQGSTPMNRLLQGDVGSGKTIVAFLAMYATFFNGHQSAFMAPTEILARQHYQSLTDLLSFTGVRVELLLGATPEKEKSRILAALKNGAVDMLVSTHAAISDAVEFQSLAFAVTDEQHRFGVRQRAQFSSKGTNPHMLVMSATPIPRTVALLWYADLDVSIIDELPKGRVPIETIVITPEYEERMATFMKDNIEQGRQAFIICPLIEENEDLALESVEALYRRLQSTYFRSYRMAFLHGRMPSKEKDQIMRDFKEKKYDILVSTTVIEVGIDIPNANVITIYNAERFGLAQLHQLRGRVGRGQYASYCVLINYAETEEALQRMQIMQRTNDGFEIATADLEMRGSGELLGQRQHGVGLFQIANVAKDQQWFQETNEIASTILRADPYLSQPIHQRLRISVEEKFRILEDGVILN